MTISPVALCLPAVTLFSNCVHAVSPSNAHKLDLRGEAWWVCLTWTGLDRSIGKESAQNSSGQQKGCHDSPSASPDRSHCSPQRDRNLGRREVPQALKMVLFHVPGIQETVRSHSRVWPTMKKKLCKEKQSPWICFVCVCVCVHTDLKTCVKYSGFMKIIMFSIDCHYQRYLFNNMFHIVALVVSL